LLGTIINDEEDPAETLQYLFILFKTFPPFTEVFNPANSNFSTIILHVDPEIYPAGKQLSINNLFHNYLTNERNLQDVSDELMILQISTNYYSEVVIDNRSTRSRQRYQYFQIKINSALY
jgi:hypothetical protein